MTNELSPLDQIDIIVNQAIEQDDPDVVFQQIRNLEEKKELIEAAKSKFFFTLDEVWEQFSVSRKESLYTQAFEKLNYHPATVDRHITLWKFGSQMPEQIRDKPVRQTWHIAKMLSQGYEPSEDEWKSLERSESPAEVREVLREIKGQPPRKGSAQPYLDPEGTLYVWDEDVRENFGYLNINSSNELVQRMIARIIADKVIKK